MVFNSADFVRPIDGTTLATTLLTNTPHADTTTTLSSSKVTQTTLDGCTRRSASTSHIE